MQSVKSKIRTIHLFVIKTVELQLFLMGLSLPILIAWGLPISMVSWFSTPLFAPLFFLFLLCCIGMFFAYFIPLIPVWPIAYLLEMVTHSWLYLLSWYRPWWLIGFINPHPLVLLLLPCVMIATMHYKKFIYPWQRISAMTVAIVTFCLLLKLYEWAHYPKIVTIPCHTGSLCIISGSGYTVAIDRGALATRPANSQWIDYELIPELTKVTGKTKFTHLICLQSSIRTIEVLRTINKVCQLTKIIIPSYTGYCVQSYFYQLRMLKKEIAGSGTLFSVTKNNPYKLYLNNQAKLHVSYAKEIAYGGATFLLLSVQGNVDNTKLTIDAQKLEKAHSKNKKE